MAGENVDTWGKSFYHLNSGQSASNGYLVSSVLENLLLSFTGGSAVSGKGVTGTSLNSNTTIAGPLSTSLNNTTPSPIAGAPKAGINWILFDEQFRPVSGGVGFDLTGRMRSRPITETPILRRMAIFTSIAATKAI